MSSHAFEHSGWQGCAPGDRRELAKMWRAMAGGPARGRGCASGHIRGVHVAAAADGQRRGKRCQRAQQQPWMRAWLVRHWRRPATMSCR